MPKFLEEMMGCRRRSKFSAKSAKDSGSSKKLGIFGAREREEKKNYPLGGPHGPRRPVGATSGQAAPSGFLVQGLTPLAIPRCLQVTFLTEKSILFFLDF